jgi:hypothetical protein
MIPLSVVVLNELAYRALEVALTDRNHSGVYITARRLGGSQFIGRDVGHFARETPIREERETNALRARGNSGGSLASVLDLKAILASWVERMSSLALGASV